MRGVMEDAETVDEVVGVPLVCREGKRVFDIPLVESDVRVAVEGRSLHGKFEAGL